MIIEFFDQENTYGTIETEENSDRIEKALDNYRDNNDEYNIDDFFDYLKEEGFKFKILKVEADREIYF